MAERAPAVINQHVAGGESRSCYVCKRVKDKEGLTACISAPTHKYMHDQPDHDRHT